MLGAETAADKAVSGYLTFERVTLATSPTGSSYSWGLSIPQGSSSDRSGISSTSVAAPTFLPDVGGEYVATCTVDGTFYVIRISVTKTAVATTQEALRLQVKADASVAAPGTGSAIYHSDELDHLAEKVAGSTVRRIGTCLRGTVTWDPASIADGAITSTTVTVTGAAVGDTVSVGFSVAVPAGAVLAGAVTSANTVTATIFNKTGSPLDLGSGTLRADVWQ